MPAKKDYKQKRSFDQTPEPQPEVRGDVDPGKARPGESFVIHQHHATRLHFDLRLEMFNGRTPVLVSWAVPKNLPAKKGKPKLAIHVEDHPFEYGSFSGSIPKGNYGAGQVRIFDSGTYEMLEQEPGKITFKLNGKRLQGIWHMVLTDADKNEWLTFLKEQLREPPEPPPAPEPMLATLVAEAFDDDRWAFEPKWDGIRAIGICEEETKLITRNAKDVTVAYPELHKIHEQLVALDAMIDGEIVAMDEGRPSFELLQSRMHVRNPRDIERLAKSTPVTYMAFDLIYLDGKSLVGEPFEKRRELLEEIVVVTPKIQVSPSIVGDGKALFAAASEQNLEGIIAKKLSSRYEVGRRSKNWLKIKTVFDGDVVVAGWTPGEGRRGGTIGALVLGAYDGDELRFVGSVGTGFNESNLKSVLKSLKEIERETTPLSKSSLADVRREVKNANWVEPELVATVEFRQLTSAGKLRAPSFKALREDKVPKDCRFEDLRPPTS